MKRVLILGTGCSRCKALAERAEMAVAELGIEATVEKIADIHEIMTFSIAAAPRTSAFTLGPVRDRSEAWSLDSDGLQARWIVTFPAFLALAAEVDICAYPNIVYIFEFANVVCSLEHSA